MFQGLTFKDGGITQPCLVLGSIIFFDINSSFLCYLVDLFVPQTFKKVSQLDAKFKKIFFQNLKLKRKIFEKT